MRIRHAMAIGVVIGTTLTPAISLGQTYPTDDASPQAQLAWVSAVFRAPLAMAPLIDDPRLQAAAQGHAAYLQTNGLVGHYQTVGLPGFTGVSPGDRCRAAGFDTGCGEVASGSPIGVISWMATPWHGAPFFNYDTMGIGVSGSYSVGNGSRIGITHDLSRTTPVNRPGAAVRFWPPDGFRDLRDSWNGGEIPDPLARYEGDRATMGPMIFPVVASYCGNGEPRTDVSLTVRAADGRMVPLLVPGGIQATATHWILDGSGSSSGPLTASCLVAQPLFIAERPRAGANYTATLTQYTRAPDSGCRGEMGWNGPLPCVDQGEIARTDALAFAIRGSVMDDVPAEEYVGAPVFRSLSVARSARHLRVRFTTTTPGRATVTLRAPRAKARYRTVRRPITRAGRHTVTLRNVPRGRWTVRVELRTPSGATASITRTVRR